jgi:hypothetical protein
METKLRFSTRVRRFFLTVNSASRNGCIEIRDSAEENFPRRDSFERKGKR